MTQRTRADRTIAPAILVAIVAITLLPFVSMLLTALQPRGSAPAGLSWPAHPRWSNFEAAWTASNVLTLARSSALIVLGVVPVSLLIATMAGYALGQMRMPGARWVFLVFVLGLTIPFESAVVPLYYQMQQLGLLNTRLALILPLIGLSMPFGVFWMRAHFLTFPRDIAEAAEIDGATAWQAFRRIHLPLAVPAVSSLALLQFLATWNQFLLAIVLVDDPNKRTMAGALGAFQGEYRTDIVLLCAGSLLIMVPSVAVFLLLQRHFVKALLQGAIKG
jgi:raffinose/stachyose/melibiose transport system permease protein